MSSLSTTYDPDYIATLTAKMLIEIKAVHFNGEKPFIFPSGWASPVYIDCRKIISYPRARGAVIDFATATLAREIGFESIDIVAGGGEGGGSLPPPGCGRAGPP